MSTVHAWAWRGSRRRQRVRRVVRRLATPARVAAGTLASTAAGLAVLLRRRATHVADVTRRSDRAAALADVRAQTLRQVAHDLRAPIALVLGYLSMFEDGTLGELSPSATEAVALMRRQGQLMQRMTDQLLDVARIQDARLLLQRAPVELGGLIGEVAADVALPRAPAYRLELDLPDAPLVLEIDAQRISSAVRNLLDNAVKYSPNGGTVTCRLRRVGGFAEVSVSDTGVGIPVEHRARVFTQFGRVRTAETAGIPGAGLGLYLGREIARRHGGDLTFESTAGRGSTFRMRLALAADAEAARAAS